MASRVRGLPGSLVGAGLPAIAALRCTSQTALSASQASQLPQVMHGQQNSRLARIPCGSGLARDSSAAVYLPDRVAYIAGKPAPTRAGRERAILVAAFPQRLQVLQYPPQRRGQGFAVAHAFKAVVVDPQPRGAAQLLHQLGYRLVRLAVARATRVAGFGRAAH